MGIKDRNHRSLIINTTTTTTTTTFSTVSLYSKLSFSGRF